MATFTLAEMKRTNKQTGSEVFSGIDKNGRIRHERCTWDPWECDCVYSRHDQPSCPDYKTDAELDNAWRPVCQEDRL
jgi:hypothetical protein